MFYDPFFEIFSLVMKKIEFKVEGNMSMLKKKLIYKCINHIIYVIYSVIKYMIYFKIMITIA